MRARRRASPTPPDRRTALLVWQGVETLTESGAVAEARERFSRALDLQPNSFEALYWMGHTAASGVESLAYLERALRNAPASENPQQQLVRQRLSAIAGGVWQPPTPHELRELATIWVAAHPVRRKGTRPGRLVVFGSAAAVLLAAAASFLVLSGGDPEEPGTAVVASTLEAPPSVAVLALEEPTATPEPVASPTVPATATPLATATPSPSPTPVPQPTPTEAASSPVVVSVATFHAWVRTCPSQACESIATRDLGELVYVWEEVEGDPVGGDRRWLRVTFDEGATLSYYMHVTVLAPTPAP